MAKSNDLYDVKICIRSSVKLLGEIKDLLERNRNRESVRTVNVVAKHWADHLKKKKQNSDYYGFAWAFKMWILESYPNSKKWWSKKDNVLPRALAWSNVTKFEKNDYVGN
ncbi:hypothetical protein Tco_0388626 [Tanacetum coccineum]